MLRTARILRGVHKTRVTMQPLVLIEIYLFIIIIIIIIIIITGKKEDKPRDGLNRPPQGV